jgi:hypothetical protein
MEERRVTRFQSRQEMPFREGGIEMPRMQNIEKAFNHLNDQRNIPLYMEALMWPGTMNAMDHRTEWHETPR